VRVLPFRLIAVAAAVFAGLLVGVVAAAGTSQVSDGSIRVGLPDGWHASMAPGIQAGRRAAWILLADFPLADDAAALEGGPSVPNHKVLVSLGDFVPAGIAANWTRVGRVCFPPTCPATSHGIFASGVGRCD
jgi:hypothetical protein